MHIKKCKVVNKHNSNNIFDWDVICNHCGKTVNYGKETYLISGQMCCKHCHDDLYKEIQKDKSENYEIYKTKDYEPFGV